MREADRARLESQARDHLRGVGDADAGEWVEVGDLAVHVRRRLTADEAQSVGGVLDIRGTWEATKRLNRIRKYLSPVLRFAPDAQLP